MKEFQGDHDRRQLMCRRADESCDPQPARVGPVRNETLDADLGRARHRELVRGPREFDPAAAAEAGRKPYDRGLSDLVGQLSTRSDEFRVCWAAHNVGFHRAATTV